MVTSIVLQGRIEGICDDSPGLCSQCPFKGTSDCPDNPQFEKRIGDDVPAGMEEYAPFENLPEVQRHAMLDPSPCEDCLRRGRPSCCPCELFDDNGKLIGNEAISCTYS